MAEYKKKSVKKKLPTTKEKRIAQIEMNGSNKKTSTPKSTQNKRKDFKVLKGHKKEKKLTGIIFLATLIVLISVYLIILVFHPIGVIEYFSTLYKVMGTSSGYEVSLSGDNIVMVDRQDDYYYLLNSSELLCFNNNGKTVSKVNHGFSKPVLKTCETRALVFGQGEKNLKVYKFANEAINLKFDFPILTADISNNGTFVVSTYSDSYESVVQVYNKRGEKLYEWYCADGTVSSVLLNKDGNKLTVSSFSIFNGVVNTKIRVLNFKSADAEKTFDFQNDMLYGIYNLSGNKICAVFENNYYTLDLKKGSYVNNQTDYSYNLVESYKNNLILTSSLSANSEKSNIEIVDGKEQTLSKFTLDFSVKDLVVRGNKFYILTENYLLITDFNGNIINKFDVSFDAKITVPVSSDYCVVVSNSKIIKLNFKEGAV